jgi:hypothetical protein
MNREDNNRFFEYDVNSDLTSLPGWKICDDMLKNRIVEAAKSYIINNDAAPSNWLGTNTYHRPAMSGYKAFILLKKLEPAFLDNLSTDIWKKWASVFIGYPENNGLTGRDKTYLELINQAYKKAPQEIIK